MSSIMNKDITLEQYLLIGYWQWTLIAENAKTAVILNKLSEDLKANMLPLAISKALAIDITEAKEMTIFSDCVCCDYVYHHLGIAPGYTSCDKAECSTVCPLSNCWGEGGCLSEHSPYFHYGVSLDEILLEEKDPVLTAKYANQIAKAFQDKLKEVTECQTESSIPA